MSITLVPSRAEVAPPFRAGLLRTHDLRDVTISAHRVPRTSWRWDASAGSAAAGSDEPTVGVLFVTSGTLDMGGMSSPVGCVVVPGGSEVAFPMPGVVAGVWLRGTDLGSAAGGRSRVLSASHLALAMRGFVLALSSRAQAIDDSESEALHRIIDDLMVAVLSATDVEGGDGADVYARARALINVRYSDPAYSVQRLADELFVSARQLQRAFASAGDTPLGALRRARLAHANALTQTAGGAASISQHRLAKLSGFRNADALRRARESMIQTPSRFATG